MKKSILDIFPPRGPKCPKSCFWDRFGPYFRPGVQNVENHASGPSPASLPPTSPGGLLGRGRNLRPRGAQSQGRRHPPTRNQPSSRSRKRSESKKSVPKPTWPRNRFWKPQLGPGTDLGPILVRSWVELRPIWVKF